MMYFINAFFIIFLNIFYIRIKKNNQIIKKKKSLFKGN
jgi:hypothetical protein